MSDGRPGTDESLDKIAQAYDSEPWWYDLRGFFILTFAYRSTLGKQLRLFGNNMGRQHLEIAIGSGTLMDIILRWRDFKRMPPPERIVGVDYAEPMLAGAIRRFRNRSGIELRHGDVAAMPFADATFDTANIANAVHCFPDVDAGLRDTLRVLKPGGRLAANVLLYPGGIAPLRAIAQRINDWGQRKGILYTPYAQDDIRRRVVAAGFQIEWEERAGNTWNVIARRPAA